MMWNKNKQEGFGLVEAMVAIALLSVVIYFAMGTVSDQKKSRADRSKQSIQRYIAIQVVEHITANLRLYPPMVRNSSFRIRLPITVYYFGCLDKDGVLIGGTSYKYREFTSRPSRGSLTPRTPLFCQIDAATKDKYHYQVLFQCKPPSDNPLDKNRIEITLTTRYSDKNKSLSTRKYVVFAK